MKDKSSILTSPAFFIFFFLVGTISFIIITKRIDVPIYETYEGRVIVNNEQTIVKLDEDVDKAECIFYYINRDEWVEKSDSYDEEYDGYIIDNVRELDDETVVYVDVQTGTISLLDAIVKKDGNI